MPQPAYAPLWRGAGGISLNNLGGSKLSNRHPMLEIRIIMNSSVEDILAFKTCCSLKMFDQNLEIHVANQGTGPVTVPSYFDLEGESGFHSESIR